MVPQASRDPWIVNLVKFVWSSLLHRLDKVGSDCRCALSFQSRSTGTLHCLSVFSDGQAYAPTESDHRHVQLGRWWSRGRGRGGSDWRRNGADRGCRAGTPARWWNIPNRLGHALSLDVSWSLAISAGQELTGRSAVSSKNVLGTIKALCNSMCKLA